MKTVKLVHWKEAEIQPRETMLREAGYQVDARLEGGSRVFKSLAEDPPVAIIIDLSRLPSQGRDFALMVRKRKGTRNIPLIFVGGDSEKVAGVKELLPDAWYTQWEQIDQTLAAAISAPVEDPLVHESTFAAYAGRPLVKKLGIKPASSLALVNPPDGFERQLENMPPGVEVVYGPGKASDLTIWFCSTKGELEGHIREIVSQSASGPVWIAWPKQKSELASDLTQQDVRRVGLQNGLVDYKISAFDDTWSGLLFKYRGDKT